MIELDNETEGQGSEEREEVAEWEGEMVGIIYTCFVSPPKMKSMLFFSFFPMGRPTGLHRVSRSSFQGHPHGEIVESWIYLLSDVEIVSGDKVKPFPGSR